MGLIDLSGDLGRVDGGVGLALRDPAIEVRGEIADTAEATGPLSDRARSAADATVRELGGDPVRITVTSSYPQHVGLGSGTQAALAAATLAARLNGHDPSVRDLARRALAVDPESEAARSLLRKVGERMAWDADAALSDGAVEEARDLVRECLELVGDHPRCLAVRDRL